ncbi:hypothetical protein [Tenacibaculum ovolyticum]|uniref:hypothetical protein n=1 Tax=Tenacibaculum ovolyticum TaxID=104270 RepID=UPI0007EC8C68|nr:hypothetical protein [Tenacibaculum ovolyticum]
MKKRAIYFYYLIRLEFYFLVNRRFRQFYENYMNIPYDAVVFYNEEYSKEELDFLEVIQTKDNGSISPLLKAKLLKSSSNL